jgi:hypothetical protein
MHYLASLCALCVHCGGTLVFFYFVLIPSFLTVSENPLHTAV